MEIKTDNNLQSMKRIILIGAALAMIMPAAGLRAQDPEGTLVYALPKTVLNIEVEAIRENFHAGPYAKYAKKYLGIEARQADELTSKLKSVKINSLIEADQTSRYVLAQGKGLQTFLALTAQGLICAGDGFSGTSMAWQFSSDEKGDFSGKGVSSNYTSETATLYRNNKGSSTGIRQEMIVEKSSEDKAKEAAQMIFTFRKMRVQIVTGDTDATFSGEAMSAVLEELTRLENEYLTLFTGYSDLSTQKATFTIIPEKTDSQSRIIAFRLSDTEGLVSADNMAGKPYMLELTPEPVSPAMGQPAKNAVVHYRIPAICTAVLREGVNILLQTRIPVHQMGTDSTYPINAK